MDKFWRLEMLTEDGEVVGTFCLPDAQLALYRQHGDEANVYPITESEYSEFDAYSTLSELHSAGPLPDDEHAFAKSNFLKIQPRLGFPSQ